MDVKDFFFYICNVNIKNETIKGITKLIGFDNNVSMSHIDVKFPISNTIMYVFVYNSLCMM